MPKQNIDSSDNDGAQVSKQQRVLSNGKQNNNNNQLNLSIIPNLAPPSNDNLQQAQTQVAEQQQRRLLFE